MPHPHQPPRPWPTSLWPQGSLRFKASSKLRKAIRRDDRHHTCGFPKVIGARFRSSYDPPHEDHAGSKYIAANGCGGPRLTDSGALVCRGWLVGLFFNWILPPFPGSLSSCQQLAKKPMRFYLSKYQSPRYPVPPKTLTWKPYKPHIWIVCGLFVS